MKRSKASSSQLACEKMQQRPHVLVEPEQQEHGRVRWRAASCGEIRAKDL